MIGELGADAWLKVDFAKALLDVLPAHPKTPCRKDCVESGKLKMPRQKSRPKPERGRGIRWS